eukprot:12624235-Ditylum_brightwellii.AAC.1
MVLKGQFNAKELDELHQLCLHHCKKEPINNPAREKITKQMWKGKVTKCCESTTTSPSGRHLGHFKVLICWFAEVLETEEGKGILIWKELVEESEKNGTINHGLHGGYQ